MANTDREFVALTAYLNLMGGKGADSANLELRKQFLLRLIPLLAGEEQQSELFRRHVDQALRGAEKKHWPFFTNVAQEYFRFWVNDIKGIAALHASGGYGVAPVRAPVPTEDLQTLWNRLDQEQLTVTEKWPLKAYSTALKHEGAERGVIETRTRLVKLLLLRLREVEDGGDDHYRVAAHALIPLFELKETRDIFLRVVREFYYFWIGDPKAVRHISVKPPR